MPRKPTVPRYKTTEKIKRACKQLLEYERYNFWYFEFGARAFTQNEGTKKQRNICIGLALFLDTICGLYHSSDSPLIPLLPNTPLLHLSNILREERLPTIDEYKPYWPLLYTFFSKSHHTEFMIQSVFDNIDDEYLRNSVKKQYKMLLFYSSKYGIYPHQILFIKNFAKRYREAICGEKNYALMYNSITGSEAIQDNNFNHDRIKFLKEVDISSKILYIPMSIPLIDYQSEDGRKHLHKIMNSYVKDESFFTTRNPCCKFYTSMPVRIEYFNESHHPRVKHEKRGISFFIKNYQECDIKNIVEAILNFIEKGEYIQLNIENLLSINYDTSALLELCIDKNHLDYTPKRCKIHLESELYLYYYQNICKNFNSFSNLYKILPFALKECSNAEIKKHNDDKINIILKEDFHIENMKIFNEQLNYECDYINIIHQYINGYNKQISIEMNSLGLFIWDLHNDCGIKLEHIYAMILDNLNKNLDEYLAKYPKLESYPNVRKDIRLVRDVIADQNKKKKKDENELDSRILRHAYEQVQRHIENHLRHPFYQKSRSKRITSG